ncbi:MAG: cysteine desulfurase [Acidobacteriota bacterium]
MKAESSAQKVDIDSGPFAGGLDAERILRDFPILQTRVHGRRLAYLDNAATTQKPLSVIERIRHYYLAENSNVHRGVHHLSQVATDAYEASRRKIQRFINARRESEVVFVRGATEGVNLVAQTLGRQRLSAGDEVLITAMEHHSNIVPWQLLCEQTGARLRVIPMSERGELRLEELYTLIGAHTRLVAVVHVSNALGTVNPVEEIIRIAHTAEIPVLVDAAQSVPHLGIDVQALDADFVVFSGHKMYGPTGIGVVYGKQEYLESMPPYQGGGDMIASVTFEKTTYNELPYKFEAGTPNIAGAIGLGAAVDYLESVGMENIQAHEEMLLDYTHRALSELPDVRIIGTAERKAGVVSFVMDGIHPHDLGTVLDQLGVAIRTGHHCAQPVMDFFGVPATARASLAFYNVPDDIDLLVQGLKEAREVFTS